jgi:5'-3' exonuclease
MLIQKIINKNDYIADPLLEKYSTVTYNDTNPIVEFMFEDYKKEYYIKRNIVDVKTACQEYVRGCQWIFTYYNGVVNDWSWIYPFNYSPFAMEIAEYIHDAQQPVVCSTVISPFEQLLCVIPPKSAHILPYPLNTLLQTSVVLEKYCPSSFIVNCEGKKYEYEGIVELPIIDISSIKQEYFKHVSMIDPLDIKRNIPGKNFIYTKSGFKTHFKSYYGDIINCMVDVNILDTL